MNSFSLTTSELGDLLAGIAIYGIDTEDKRVLAAVAKVQANIPSRRVFSGYEFEPFSVKIVED